MRREETNWWSARLDRRVAGLSNTGGTVLCP